MRQHTINIKEKHFAVLHDSLIVVGKREIRKSWYSFCRPPLPLWCLSSGWLWQRCTVPHHQTWRLCSSPWADTALLLSSMASCSDRHRCTYPRWHCSCSMWCNPGQLLYTAPNPDVWRHPNLLPQSSPAAVQRQVLTVLVVVGALFLRGVYAGIKSRDMWSDWPRW